MLQAHTFMNFVGSYLADTYSGKTSCILFYSDFVH